MGILVILLSGCISNVPKQELGGNGPEPPLPQLQKPGETGSENPLPSFKLFYDIDPKDISLKLSDVALDFNSLSPSESVFDTGIDPEAFKVFWSPDDRKSLVQSIDVFESTNRANSEFLNILQGHLDEYNKNPTQYLTFLDLVGESSITSYDQNYCSEETFFQISNIEIAITLIEFHKTCSIQPQDTLKYAKMIENKILQIQ